MNRTISHRYYWKTTRSMADSSWKQHPFFTVWLPAGRPKTLPAALAPVIMGTGLALHDGAFHLWAALAAGVGALLIQIGTNYANDYFDHIKGADDKERLGPVRATATGQVPPEAMKKAFLITFGLTIMVGLYLVVRGGWPVVVIGALSILSGIAYTGGPFPLAYNGLGDLFVLIFFGPVAVAGTYYVQALEVNTTVILLGLAPGLLSTAILTVNNLRDIVSDRRAGKHTLAVRFGEPFARAEYLFCLFGAPVIVAAITWTRYGNDLALISLFALLFSIPAIRIVLNTPPGRIYNMVLADTGKTLFIFSLLFAIGWNL